MKPCWKEAGLTEEGGLRAEEAIDRMEALVVELCHAGVARIVLEEALFRVFELPKRTPNYRTKYARENGG